MKEKRPEKKDAGSEPGSISGALEAIIDRWSSSPEVLAFVHRVLDKRDRKGYFPKTFTYRRGERSLRTLGLFLPPRALQSKSDDRIVVHLGRVQEMLDREAEEYGNETLDLEAIFDALAGRTPRDLRHEREAWSHQLAVRIQDGVAEGRRRAARRGVMTTDAAVEELVERLGARDSDERRQIATFAKEASFPQAAELVARIVAGCLLVRAERQTTFRLDLLSIAIAGDTKSLRPETADYARLADTLLSLDPELRARLERDAHGSRPVLRRLAFEHHGIALNDTPLDVLVQGPLIVELESHTLRDVATLSREGLPSKLSYRLLRRAVPRVAPETRVVTVENESAFHLLAEHFPADLVIFTGGQPSWPVTLLLGGLARASSRGRFFHTGDLDRSGLLILRTLRERTKIPVEPLWMDAETFTAMADVSLPMKGDEPRHVARLLEGWEEPWGRELLEALARSSRWVEQEAVVERLLGLERPKKKGQE